MASADKLELLIDGLSFGEGPRWHEGRLFFSDFYTHRVLAIAPGGSAETIAEVPQRPSGLGWLPDGRLLIVSMVDRCLMVKDQAGLKRYADLSGIAGGPCNDMVVDSKGRAYVGNFGFDRWAGQSERPACLARVDPDGRVSRAAEDLLFPNGTVITPDGKTMVIGETQGHRLTAFDIAADGTLSNRRVFAQLDAIFPDGICLDAEGAIWVADARGGNGVVRVFQGGRIERRIAVGAQRYAYACMLGGDERRTLFICTNSGSGPEIADKREAKVEFIRVDVPGAGLP